MSRQTLYHDSRLTVIGGDDHALGKFLQVYDKEIETEEGEGLVFDWSELFGVEINFTGESSNIPPQTIINTYIKNNMKTS
jgi:hypothetical protein